ncbi:hypothetical protein IQ260_14720 [Leptolyngbya cf. ectocarpi LEGE 11479]|uniref:Helix-turn-helix domain-containing protein n=1 Tax=Leptolyngbya cf. ectocarpi LEGE 11479 TaxID=1828722 RepID=A0A928ZUX3_LEPEC|nr:hypothetical protein [Leptolyngbya ectocarpi]MBE9067904.1 hypothetical protein [Leptolyngbya cf. ectocarpi LEGE 11479]
MTHNPSGRQKSSHLRLTAAEVKDMWNEGEYTPQGYLHHLILAHRSPGWVWRIENVSQFCKDWGLNRRTFYRAKAALIDRGVLEEEVFGAIELKLTSTNVCDSSDTPVSDESLVVPDLSHSVPDLSQLVTNGSHSTLETVDTQSACNSTSLKQLITPTTQDVCVSENVNNSEVRTEVSVFDRLPAQVENAESPNEAIPPGKETYAPPILLEAKKKFGINLEDTQLRKSIEFWPERVEVAIACLEEKQLTVKYPTRFLQRAIEEDWKPERRTGGSEWRDWFNEAYNRGLVSAGREDDGVQYVLTADDHWVPFEHLRRQSWEQLEAQLKPITVDAHAAPDELTPGQSQIIEAMAVLVEG